MSTNVYGEAGLGMRDLPEDQAALGAAPWAAAGADLARAGAAIKAGEPGEAVEPLRRVAAGEDPVSGPLAAVALAVIDSGDPTLLPGLAAELSRDLLTARIVYEAAAGSPYGRVLLGGLLTRTGGEARARQLFAEVAGGPDPLAAAYAGFLLGGLPDGDATREEALRRACAVADAGRGEPHGLLPWIATRLTELLVNREADPDTIREAATLALREKEISDPAMAGAAGLALPEKEIAGPAMARGIIGVLDGDPPAVRAALARLEAWSPELHARGSRLATWLGARIVELSGKREEHPLVEVLAELDASPESAAYALWLRGRGRGSAADWDGAITEWRRAADSGVIPYARWAGSCLSVLFTLRGDGEAAKHALRHGVNTITVVELGDMLRKAGRDEDAKVAYDLALSSEEPGVTSRAWLGLGYVREDDNPTAAADAFRKALELGKGAVAIAAATALGHVLRRTGDEDGAVAAATEAHRRCVGEGFSPKLRALTGRELGDLCRRRRDWPAAIEAYRSCVEAYREMTGEEYPYEARWPLLYLGAVEGLGDEYEASTRNLTKLLEIFAEPEDAEQREITVMAALHLGMSAKFRQDLDTALPWFTRVIDSGDMNHIPAAIAHLAELHYWLGDKAEAARLYERTLEISEDPEYVAEAAYRLSEHLVESTDPVDVPRVIALLERTLSASFSAFDDDAHALLARLRP